jgi:Putative zinc-finger
MYDAAYLLGALTPQDRAEFEGHLETCAECRNSVNQLAGMPGLLSSVSPENLMLGSSEEPPLPDTLLPKLLHEVQRTRFRRRWVGGAVGVAAAAAVAVAVVFGVTGPSSSPPGGGSSVAAQSMTKLVPQIPVKATFALTEKDWGTAMRVWCVYNGEVPGHQDERFTYTMIVTDKSGATQQIAAWSAKAGEPVVATAATSVPKSQIASVEIRGPSDIPLLQLSL